MKAALVTLALLSAGCALNPPPVAPGPVQNPNTSTTKPAAPVGTPTPGMVVPAPQQQPQQRP